MVFFDENEMRDLNNLNATVRWTVAQFRLDGIDTITFDYRNIKGSPNQGRLYVGLVITLFGNFIMILFSTGSLFTRSLICAEVSSCPSSLNSL